MTAAEGPSTGSGTEAWSSARRGELLAQEVGPVMFAALESAPVRLVPTQLGRSLVLGRYIKWSLLVQSFRTRNEADALVRGLEQAGRDVLAEYPSQAEFVSIPILGARDCYWLGSAAWKLLRREGVPRSERVERVARSTGLLLTSHLRDTQNKSLRSLTTRLTRPQNYYGKLRARQDHLSMTPRGYVHFREEYAEQLLGTAQLDPDSGCPAHRVRQPSANTSMVVDFWQAYARKVFTPWGRQRSA